MGVHEGMGHLAKAMKELMLRWNETKMSWNDANTRQFEKTYLEPLERDLRSATGAMDQMAVLLHQIYRDCE